jgi:hypothetical protein
MSAQLATLRRILGEKFPDAMPVTHRTTEQVATGIAPLDHALPSGGFPRGRLSVWAPNGGATALMRSACSTISTSGERSAWIDGNHAVLGDFWKGHTTLLRPDTRLRGLRAAEELLRSGSFALVVLAGIDPQAGEAVRLTRAAREGGGALVVLTPHTALSSLRLTSQINPRSYCWRRSPFGEPACVHDVTVHVHAHALGWNAHAEIILPVLHHELRLSLESGLADRRGVHR